MQLLSPNLTFPLNRCVLSLYILYGGQQEEKDLQNTREQEGRTKKEEEVTRREFTRSHKSTRLSRARVAFIQSNNLRTYTWRGVVGKRRKTKTTTIKAQLDIAWVDEKRSYIRRE